MQEDKELTFDAIDTVKGCLALFTGMISTIDVYKRQTVDYGACVMKVCQGILRKRVWPVPVQWMAVIRIVQLWKVRMPLLIRSGSGICWTIRLSHDSFYSGTLTGSGKHNLYGR